jgi:hypothetical protein
VVALWKTGLTMACEHPSDPIRWLAPCLGNLQIRITTQPVLSRFHSAERDRDTHESNMHEWLYHRGRERDPSSTSVHQVCCGHARKENSCALHAAVPDETYTRWDGTPVVITSVHPAMNGINQTGTACMHACMELEFNQVWFVLKTNM